MIENKIIRKLLKTKFEEYLVELKNEGYSFYKLKFQNCSNLEQILRFEHLKVCEFIIVYETGRYSYEIIISVKEVISGQIKKNLIDFLKWRLANNEAKVEEIKLKEIERHVVKYFIDKLKAKERIRLFMSNIRQGAAVELADVFYYEFNNLQLECYEPLVNLEKIRKGFGGENLVNLIKLDFTLNDLYLYKSLILRKEKNVESVYKREDTIESYSYRFVEKIDKLSRRIPLLFAILDIEKLEISIEEIKGILERGFTSYNLGKIDVNIVECENGYFLVGQRKFVFKPYSSKVYAKYYLNISGKAKILTGGKILQYPRAISEFEITIFFDGDYLEPTELIINSLEEKPECIPKGYILIDLEDTWFLAKRVTSELKGKVSIKLENWQESRVESWIEYKEYILLAIERNESMNLIDYVS